MAHTKEILTLAVEIGDTMLRSGAEIYRVEDSLIHILESCDVDNFDVYVLSNGIFASANEDQEDACSMIRHVPISSVNLSKVAALNQLVRDICNHKCSIAEATVRLTECKHIPPYPKPVLVAGCAVACGCFCYLYGGTAIDMIFATCIGIVEQFFLFSCEKHHVSRFLTTVYASLVVAVLSILAFASGLPVHHDKIIIGDIMPLVPGIVFTTSIRDFYNRDYLSGTIHLIDALLTALCIAVGICLPIVLFHYLGGGLAL